eukprot:1161755-Pelagomonas_calceolata.AAC.8
MWWCAVCGHPGLLVHGIRMSQSMRLHVTGRRVHVTPYGVCMAHGGFHTANVVCTSCMSYLGRTVALELGLTRNSNTLRDPFQALSSPTACMHGCVARALLKYSTLLKHTGRGALAQGLGLCNALFDASNLCSRPVVATRLSGGCGLRPCNALDARDPRSLPVFAVHL